MKHERPRGPYARLETKSYSDSLVTAEIKAISDRIQRSFSEAKSQADERFAALEHEIVEAKRAAIFARGAGEIEPKSAALRNYEQKLISYVRGGGKALEGELETAASNTPEIKALSTSVAADGGFLVTPQIDRQIHELAKSISPIREIADTVQISGGSYETVVSTSECETAWVGEQSDRNETATPRLEKIEIVPGEIMAMPVSTQHALDDAFTDIEQWLSFKVAAAFAIVEGKAFVCGNGVVKPRGLLDYPIVADASWTWGSVGYIATGTSGGFTPPAASPLTQGADVLYDVVASLKPDYRANARWLMNRKTIAAVRKLKDLQGNYVWQQGLVAGQPSLLCGFPVTEAEDMPDIAANSYSIAFGDFRQAYTIVDRVGTRILRDPFTSKGFVKFYTTKRVGGAVTNFEAYKLLKFATS